jgi:hypothetical protein
MEGEAEQALLAAAADAAADIEERSFAHLAVRDDADRPGLFDHEQARIALGRGDQDRLAQPVGDELCGKGHRLGRGRSGEQHRYQQHQRAHENLRQPDCSVMNASNAASTCPRIMSFSMNNS